MRVYRKVAYVGHIVYKKYIRYTQTTLELSICARPSAFERYRIIGDESFALLTKLYADFMRFHRNYNYNYQNPITLPMKSWQIVCITVYVYVWLTRLASASINLVGSQKGFRIGLWDVGCRRRKKGKSKYFVYQMKCRHSNGGQSE